MKLVSLCTAWVVGVCIGSLVSLPACALIGVSVAIIVPCLVWRRLSRRKWAGLCLGMLTLGVAWYQVRVSEPTLQNLTGQTVVMEGKVVRDTQYSDGGAWLGFSASQVRVGDSSEGVSGKVVVYTDPFPCYSQGDVLRITGQIRPVSEVSNAGYRTFLLREGFVGTVSDSAEIELLQRSWLFGFRNRLAECLSTALAEPQASLAEGLLLGIRSHMPDELRSDFSRTGTSHLLAISGFNLAVIGGAILNAAAWLLGRQRPFYLVVTLAVVWMYSALTGMQPPVLRSAVMFSLLLAALWLGRPGSALTALAVAGAIMVGIDPRVLWDVSFQLSFVAVAGLIMIQPPLQQWGERVMPEGGWVSFAVKPVFSSFAVGMAAIVATLPLMIYHFQSFSLVGLPATMVASVFVTAATMMAGLTALLGLVAPTPAWAAGCVASFFLMCITATVEWFSRLPLASVETGSVDAAVVWVCYGGLLGLVCRGQIRSAASAPLGLARRWLERLEGIAWRLPRKRTAGVLLVCASLIWVGFANLPATELEVSFLDVGQGDAVLILTPAGQQILIDGGPNPDTVSQRLGERLPFWDKSLDMVVLTHCHDDHLVGLMGVLQRYRVDHVLDSGYGEGDLYREWVAQLGDKGIDLMIARSGQQIDLGEGIVLEVVHPGDDFIEGTASEANSNSVVLRLVWKKVSFLLAGDADEEAEQDILYGGVLRDLHSDVLKVGHHGSRYSTSPEFLAVVAPEVAVISVGEGNTFGHPSDQTLARLNGVEVYRTDECGTITFTTDGERLWLRTARSPGGGA